MAIQNSLNAPLPSTNGQTWIGDTVSGRPVANTLTPGTGISIVNGPGTIVISQLITNGLGLTWNNAPGNTNCAPNNGYYVTGGVSPSMLLPSTASVNDVVAVAGASITTTWRIITNGSNTINYLTSTSGTVLTSGVTNAFAAAALICYAIDGSGNRKWTTLFTNSGTFTLT